MKIAMSADSTCAITQIEAKAMGIFILPLNVIVEGKEYHDDININQTILKKMMRGGDKIHTSTPTPYEIETYFDNIFSKGYEKIIHLTISSKLSSMFDLFTVTCKEKYKDKIEIINSLSVCSFMGNLVRKGKMLIDENKDLDFITKAIKKDINSNEIYFIPESLTFLKRGGRVSPAVAMIGNLIGIKPILRFHDGEISKYSSTRTIKKGYEDIFKIFIEKNFNPSEYEMHIVEFDCEQLCDKVLTKAKILFPKFTVKRTFISINVCAHCGPGTIGIGMSKK